MNIKDYTTTEMCPHCGAEVEILKKGISACPICGGAVLPCSECEDCDYNKCPYGHLHHGAQKSDINTFSVDVLKWINERLSHRDISTILIKDGTLWIPKDDETTNTNLLRHIEFYKDNNNLYRIYLQCSRNEYDFNGEYVLKNIMVSEASLISGICALLEENKHIPFIGPRYIVAENDRPKELKYVVWDRLLDDYYLNENQEKVSNNDLIKIQAVLAKLNA